MTLACHEDVWGRECKDSDSPILTYMFGLKSNETESLARQLARL